MNTLPISCAAQVQESNKKLPVRTWATIGTVWQSRIFDNLTLVQSHGCLMQVSYRIQTTAEFSVIRTYLQCNVERMLLVSHTINNFNIHSVPIYKNISHCKESVVKDSSLLGYYTASTGKQLHTWNYIPQDFNFHQYCCHNLTLCRAKLVSLQVIQMSCMKIHQTYLIQYPNNLYCIPYVQHSFSKKYILQFSDSCQIGVKNTDTSAKQFRQNAY